MMDRAVNKATCGFTSVGQRSASHKVPCKAFVSQNGAVKKLLGGKCRMVAVQMAKKAPEMPPVVSPTEGEVRINPRSESMLRIFQMKCVYMILRISDTLYAA